MAETTREQLIRLMVRRDLSAIFPKREVEIGEIIFELKNFGCTAVGISDIDLAVRAGEIVGVAGLIGAGRTELANTIFGLRVPDSGEIRLRGHPIKIGHPCEAIDFGIAYLPEDRRQHGVVPDFPISEHYAGLAKETVELCRFQFWKRACDRRRLYSSPRRENSRYLQPGVDAVGR